MSYGPFEVGNAQESERPYNTGVDQQRITQARSDAQTTHQPAVAQPSPSPTPTEGGPVNPGPPMRAGGGGGSFGGDEAGYEVPVLGGITRASDWLSRGFSAALGAVPGPDGEIPLAGAKGVTDRTNAQDFLPSIARGLMDSFADPVVQAGADAATGGHVDTLTEQHQKERAAELVTQYGGALDDKTAMRIAQLEETHNRLGGSLLIEAAIVSGFTPIGIAASGALTAISVAGGLEASVDPGAADRIARGDTRLPQGSVGRAVVENAMPELAVLQPIRSAYNAALLRLGVTRMAGTAEQVAEVAADTQGVLESVEKAADSIAAKGGPAVSEAEAIADVARVDRAAIGPQQVAQGLVAEDPVNVEEDVIAAAQRTIEREGHTLQTQLQNLGPLVQDAMSKQISKVTGELARAYDVDFLKKKYGENWRAFYGSHSFETIDAAISSLERTADENHVTLAPSLLARLGAARAAAENVTIQSEAQRTIWKAGAQIAAEEKNVTKIAAGKAATAERQAAAKVESGAAKVDRAKARLEQVRQDAEQAQRLRYQQDVAAAASKVEGAQDATKPGAVAKAAAPKVEKMSAEVAAAADAERARLARRASTAGTRVSLTASDIISRVQERMAEINKKIAGRERNIASVKGDEAPKTGYVTADSEQAWEQARLHTGKFDWGADVRQAMVDYAEKYGDRVEQDIAAGRVSLHSLTTSLAHKTNAEASALARTIKSTYGADHKVLRTFYVADEVLGSKMREWHDAGVLFSEGKIGAEELDRVTAELLDFQTNISLGKGEIGRILNSFRLQKTEAAAGLRSVRNQVKITYGEMETAAKQLDSLAGNVADATDAAARTQARIDEMENQAVALVKQIEDGTKASAGANIVASERAAAEEALTEARIELNRVKNQQRVLSDAAIAKIQAAQKAFDDASAAIRPLEEAHQAAVDAAAIATDAARKSYVSWATKLKMKPEDLRALSYIDPNDTESVIRAFRDATPTSWGTRLTTYLLNSTYGAVQSLEQNFVFDAIVLARQQLISTALGTRPGRAIGNAIAGSEVFVKGENAASMGALTEAAQDSFLMFGKIVMKGESPEEALKYGMENIEQLVGASGGHKPIIPGARIAAIPIEGVLRLLNAPDAATRLLATAFEQRRLAAVRGSIRAGDAGAAEDLAKLAAGDPEVTAEAARVAARMTTNDLLNRDGVTGRFLHALNSDFKDFRPGAVLVPAARWGLAYQRNSLRAMGGGLITGFLKARKARGLSGDERIFVGREAARDMAEGMMGAGLVASGGALLSAGLLTGAEPDDDEGKRQWKEQGKQAVSVKIAGNWVPLVALGPIGVPLALVAMIGDQANAKDEWTQADRLGRAAQLMGRYITDVPAFTGTYRLMDAIRSSVAYGLTDGSARFLALQADRVVPLAGVANSLVPVFDKYQRAPEDFMQMLAARLPGFSQTVPAVQRFGEAQERPISGAEVFNPFSAPQQQALSPASGALADNDVRWTGVISAIGGQKLTDAEARSFESISGPLVKEWTESLIASDIYRAEANPIKRQSMMNSIVTEARTYGREMVAYDAIKSARTPQEVTRAAKMMRSVASLWEYAQHIEALATDGRLPPEVAASLDSDRGMLSQDAVAPTTQEILSAAPFVRQYLSIPPFTRGTPDQWAQYDAAVAEAGRIEKTFGPQEAGIFRRTNPVIRLLSGAANPMRTRFLDQNPALKPYVAGLRHQAEG